MVTASHISHVEYDDSGNLTKVPVFGKFHLALQAAYMTA